MALTFADPWAHVVLAGSRRAGLDAVAQEIGPPRRKRTVIVSVRDVTDVDAVVKLGVTFTRAEQ